MILVYFPSGGCDVLMMLSIIISLLQSYRSISWIVQECIGLSEELFLMFTSVSTTGRDMNATNLKGVMKNQDIKCSSFKI